MLKSSLSAFAFSLLAVIAHSAYADNAAVCSSSFYCYGSDKTPAGAVPVRVVTEGAPNQGTLIENVSRTVMAVPDRPVARTTVTRTTPNTNVSPVTRVAANASVVGNLTSRPSILDANLPPAQPTRRVVIAATPRTQPTTSRTAASRPARVVASTAQGCGTLIDKATKAESQGVVYAKTGQSTRSRQAFQEAADFRTQAKSLNCSV